MEPQKSSYWKFASGFLAIIFVAVASAITVFYFQFRSKQTSAPKPPQGDEIVITKLPNGDQLVENRTQGYRVTVPEELSLQSKGQNNGSIQFLAPENSSIAKCDYGISKIQQNNNFTDLKNWYRQSYSEVEDLPTTFRDVIMSGHKALEVKTDLSVHPSGGIKSIYILYGPTIYGFGYNLYSKNDEDKCDPGLVKMINSFVAQ